MRKGDVAWHKIMQETETGKGITMFFYNTKETH